MEKPYKVRSLFALLKNGAMAIIFVAEVALQFKVI